MQQNINNIIRQLDWNNSIDLQRDAIEQLVKIGDKDIYLLVQPYDKSIGKILQKYLSKKSISDSRNVQMAPRFKLAWSIDCNGNITGS